MYLVSLDNIQDNTREEKGCYKSSCTSYHWTTYRITLVKKKDVINPHVPRIIGTTYRITLVKKKGCYKSSCTSYHWTTYRITLDNTREEKGWLINPHVLVSLDNIHDNTREEKDVINPHVPRITLVKKKDVINPHCTSYHWTTYRITLVKKKDVINPHVLVSLDNIQDNTREEKDVINPHVLISLDNIQDNTREEKGCYKSSCTSYHWTTYMITLVKEKGCYKSSCTSYHWTTYMITLVKKKDVINPHVPRIIGQHTG
ncbi:unnamed protein product [Mytilus edulis]|uniref:Uncharacterized protein n=1 Tax=Mytilus edulis TaxID=6550 RepID=A0A8S3UKI3_MYTED|nr:unnamed protein product [Mytilus edulis]